MQTDKPSHKAVRVCLQALGEKKTEGGESSEGEVGKKVTFKKVRIWGSKNPQSGDFSLCDYILFMRTRHAD
jgi:hypothetical protein